MKSTFKFGAFIGALALSAGMAQAETIVFTPQIDGGNTISDAGSDNFRDIDINRDGVNDVTLGIDSVPLIDSNDVGLEAFLSEARGLFPVDDIVTNDDIFLPPRFFGGQSVRISENLFSAGDTIGSDTFGDGVGGIGLFGTNPFGIPAPYTIPDEGNSAFFGIQIDIFTLDDSQDAITFDTETFFGFIQVSHGSIVIGQVGYDPTGAAVVVPDTMTPVPLPAGGALLLTGMLGLAALRRRQTAKA